MATTHDDLIRLLADHVGGTDVRLIEEVVRSGVPATGDATRLVAQKDVVVDAVSKAEGARLTPDAQRQRSRRLNLAAKELGRVSYGGRTPFKLSATKFTFVLALDATALDVAAQRKAGGKAIASTDKDANIDPGDYEAPQFLPEIRVFISHAHEDDAVEEVVKRFHRDLEQVLSIQSR